MNISQTEREPIVSAQALEIERARQARADRIERELLDASQAIGGICESASWFTAILASHIEANGKPVGDYTVAELMALHRKHSDRANEILGSTKY